MTLQGKMIPGSKHPAVTSSGLAQLTIIPPATGWRRQPRLP